MDKPHPWNTFRELPENELAKRVDALAAKVTDPSCAIFNFHAPPYRSGLDEAPGLDENLRMKAGGRAMQPVGFTSIRTAIERVQPLLGLHGHIQESRRPVRIGPTLALNPRSSYEEACCRARSSRSARKSQDKTYLPVSG